MIGGLPVTDASNTPTRLALLLWGESSVGKTTYAATAPGVKLWLNLDPEGKNSIIHRPDVMVVDLDGLSIDDLFNKLQNDNPLNLDNFLSEHPEVKTVVLDSATALSFRALQKTVRDQVGASKGFSPSIEAPGISAYGGRNSVVLACLTGLLKVTDRHNCHCIITTHEDDAKIDQKTNEVISYSMVLGGKLVNNFTWRLSEIWHMSLGFDDKRRVSVWQTDKRKPMKSRMFQRGTGKQFLLPYDPDLPDEGQPYTIADIYDRWIQGGRKSIPIPESAKTVRKLK
jgi:hypothetical protein